MATRGAPCAKCRQGPAEAEDTWCQWCNSVARLGDLGKVRFQSAAIRNLASDHVFQAVRLIQGLQTLDRRVQGAIESAESRKGGPHPWRTQSAARDIPGLAPTGKAAARPALGKEAKGAEKEEAKEAVKVEEKESKEPAEAPTSENPESAASGIQRPPEPKDPPAHTGAARREEKRSRSRRRGRRGGERHQQKFRQLHEPERKFHTKPGRDRFK